MAVKRMISEATVCDPCGRPGETRTYEAASGTVVMETCERCDAQITEALASLGKFGRSATADRPVVEEVAAAPARSGRRSSGRRAGTSTRAGSDEQIKCGDCGDTVKKTSRYGHAKKHDKKHDQIEWTAVTE